MREFLDLYPEIEISIVVDDAELDLSMREADVAIRMSPPRQPDLVQRHLMTVRHHAYASADYLKKYGTPQRPEELDKHRIIVYGTDTRPPIRNPNWLLEAGARPGYERRPILAVNNLYAILRALEGGLGVASLPGFHGARTSEPRARAARRAGRQSSNCFSSIPKSFAHRSASPCSAISSYAKSPNARTAARI